MNNEQQISKQFFIKHLSKQILLKMSDKIAQESFDYLNKLRQNPKMAIAPLQEKLQYFKGNVLHLPGATPLKMQEGPSSIQECIEFLQNQAPLPALGWDDGLQKAAYDHSHDIGPKGVTGHKGTDGSTMTERIERYGEWMGHIGENISFGQKTGKDGITQQSNNLIKLLVVLQLIVDDGVKTRGHRKNCFNSDFLLVGISSCEHTKYSTLCVMDFAEEFTHQEGGAQDKTPKPKKKQQNLIQGMQSSPSKYKLIINQEQDQGDDDEMPAGAVSCNTSTKTVTKGKQKVTTITKTYKMKDGSTQTQVQTITEG